MHLEYPSSVPGSNLRSGLAAAAGDRAGEAADLQQALDREQQTLDGHQVELDRDQAALERGAADSRVDLVPTRTQTALNLVQAAQDRNQARHDRAQAALDREHNERRDHLIDDLTGVLRRGPGLRELQHEIDRARRQEARLVVAFIDVDGLKTVNDSLGHATGDQLLRDVALALRQGLRSYDLVLRYGGDEFVCALSNAEIGHAEHRFRGVADALRVSPSHGSITWGLAELEAVDTLDGIMARADSALYRVRHGRRNPTREEPGLARRGRPGQRSVGG